MIGALAATALAGSATLLGGVLALHPGMRKPGPLAAALAFAAGLMIVLSVVEILPLSLSTLRAAGVGAPGWWTAGACATGVAAVWLISVLVPAPLAAVGTDSARLRRSGLLIALVIGLHNAPEGLMTFVTMLESPELGATLVVAIAIHNVPEGIAVAAPLYAATGRRGAALAWTGAAGAAEPVGAVAGYFLLRAILAPQLLVLTLALAAGMMIALSLRELIPAARRYQTHPAQTLGGLAAGAAVVWLSLALM